MTRRSIVVLFDEVDGEIDSRDAGVMKDDEAKQAVIRVALDASEGGNSRDYEIKTFSIRKDLRLSIILLKEVE